MNDTSISENIASLLERVRLAAIKSQRKPDHIRIVAASKTRTPDALREAYRCGLHDFGENYLQEALEKIQTLADLHPTWHFIGPIQSNKTRQIAEHFDWVHSVDRIKIARRLSEQRPEHLPPLNICLQVNISRESSKSGALPEQLAALTQEITDLPRINLRGLMAIPAATEDVGLQTQAFRQVRELGSELLALNPAIDTLSIGMSSDLEAAIAQGSTMIRVGTDIFGARER